jgi:uncharacterized damage-inducible protein DinB
MADLLECLLQIKALASTSDRLGSLMTAAAPERWLLRPAPEVWAPVEVLAHLADVELLFGTRVRMVLTSERPVLALFDQRALAMRANYLAWPPALALERFSTRRHETVELLESCDAAELGRVGIHPKRGDVTIADLVALLLAHDTDHFGQMRQRLGLAEPLAESFQGETP